MSATNRPGRKGLFVLLGVAAVGLLLFSLARSPAPNDGSQSELAEPDDADRDDDGADGDEPTTSTPRTTRRTTTESTLSSVGTGPVLGETVGLSLFVGGNDLKRVDLDTGEITKCESRSQPVYADDDWLMLLSGFSNELMVVPVDDPEGDGYRRTALMFFGPTPPVALGPEPGTVWLLSCEFEAPVWELLRLADGEVLRSVPTHLNFFSSTGTSGPNVSSSPAGGFFVLDGDGYRKISDARPVAVSDDYVLVQSCNDPNDCDSQWLRRESLDPVDRALPEGDLSFAWLSPEGRVLTSYGLTDPVVFDVERGMPIDIGDFGLNLESMVTSPDGRYLAFAAGGLTIIDLDTSKTFEVDGLGFGDSQLLFVENK
jgi:hypothetical protein